MKVVIKKKKILPNINRGIMVFDIRIPVTPPVHQRREHIK